ncbi:MAG: TrbG/VirB9 family P-type conjugative transfer protein [Asticcacaulis sp.]|nr:TrbG/VirB9 family P-type conjugative transfer protein [Asticcacaulis sp.]
MKRVLPLLFLLPALVPFGALAQAADPGQTRTSPAQLGQNVPARPVRDSARPPQATPYSERTPVPLSDVDTDSRLRYVDYNSGEIYRLAGCMGFQTTVTLASNEHVDTVSIGDSSAWQVTANKRGDLMFLKPTAAKAFTNLTVITDKRTYNFELRSAPEAECNKGRVAYELRFRYPPEAPVGTPVAAKKGPVDPNAFLPPVEKRNTAYSYSGATELVPLRVFDDGLSTYFRWSASVSTPAVYALNNDNSESIVNYSARGDYLVVEQVARAFVLRRGTLRAVLYNDAYKVEGLDAQSPRPRKGAK